MMKQLINMPMLNLNRIEYTNTTVWINASIKTNPCGFKILEENEKGVKNS